MKNKNYKQKDEIQDILMRTEKNMKLPVETKHAILEKLLLFHTDNHTAKRCYGQKTFSAWFPKTAVAFIFFGFMISIVYYIVIDKKSKDLSKDRHLSSNNSSMPTNKNLTGSTSTIIKSIPQLPPPGRNEVRFNLNLDGESMNRKITEAGWIDIGKSLSWKYNKGKYFEFLQDGPLIYVSVDKEPFELAGVWLRQEDDIEDLKKVLADTDNSITLWNSTSLPTEFATIEHLEKVSAFQQVGSEKLSDISLLSLLKELVALNLKNCSRIRDLSAISNSEKLESLNISGCTSISTIYSLHNTHNLKYLDMSDCINVNDISPVTQNASLTKLNLSGCYAIRDLRPLSQLTKLISLDIRQCKVSDIIAIKNMIELKYLNLSDCAVKDFSPLFNLSSLEYLDLGNAAYLADLSFLYNLKGLKQLNLWSCKRVSDISPISELNDLKTLSLRNCSNINDLSSISNLTNLTKLDVSACTKIYDLSPLANLINLKYLDISMCPQLTQENLMPLQDLISQGTVIHADKFN
ncbi:MAG: leucine-rich repeat domain-containing protein [Phycisphaerae bacterium]|nr:leucine-rich repeat domain-containing protein [Phycisphaerae bacterium]